MKKNITLLARVIVGLQMLCRGTCNVWKALTKGTLFNRRGYISTVLLLQEGIRMMDTCYKRMIFAHVPHLKQKEVHTRKILIWQ